MVLTPQAGVKRCGDASGLNRARMHRQSARRRWQKCLAHRGDHVYAVTHRAGKAGRSVHLWSTRALIMRTTAGAIGARLSLRPSFQEGRNLLPNLGRIAPRECGRLSDSCLKFEHEVSVAWQKMQVHSLAEPVSLAERISVVSAARWNYLAAPVVVPGAVLVVAPVRRSSRRSVRPVRRSSRRSCRPVRRS